MRPTVPTIRKSAEESDLCWLGRRVDGYRFAQAPVDVLQRRAIAEMNINGQSEKLLGYAS